MPAVPRRLTKLMKEFLQASGGSERIVLNAFEKARSDASKQKRPMTKKDILENIKLLKERMEPAA